MRVILTFFSCHTRIIKIARIIGIQPDFAEKIGITKSKNEKAKRGAKRREIF